MPLGGFVDPPRLHPVVMEERARWEAERWSRLTEAERERERRRDKRLQRLSDLFGDALMFAILSGLAGALFGGLFGLAFLPAVVLSAILFHALWVWALRDELARLEEERADRENAKEESHGL